MLKIFKILVTGIEGQDGIGINSTVRTTMGYDKTKQEISLLVEKVILPEVPADKSLELRDPHTTSTFTTLLEQKFTPSDFPKTGELKRWQVDYDVVKNKLVIFDAYEYSLTKITGSQSARKVARFVKERYNHDLIPLFSVDNVYQSSTDFDASVLTFWVDEVGLDINDTILINDAVDATTVTQQEKEFWMLANVNTNVIFEVLNDDDKIVSSTAQKSAKPAVLIANPVPMVPMNLDEDNTTATQIISDGGNQYKVCLPVADSYKIRIAYHRHLHDSLPDQTTGPGTARDASRKMPVRFDIDCVNGVCNKTRSVSKGYDHSNPDALSAAYGESHTVGPKPSLVGVDQFIIATQGLVVGDFIKLKLNLGNFKSYAELWIELT